MRNAGPLPLLAVLLPLLLCIHANAIPVVILESGEEYEGEIRSVTAKAIEVSGAFGRKTLPMVFVVAIRLDSILLNRPIDPSTLQNRLGLKPNTTATRPGFKPFYFIHSRKEKGPGMPPTFVHSSGPGAGRFIGGGGFSADVYVLCRMEADSAACDSTNYHSLRAPEIQALLKDVPEVAALSRKASVYSMSGLGGMLAGGVLVAVAYGRSENDAVSKSMYAVGGTSLLTGFGVNWYGSSLHSRIVRVYNEQATRKARISCRAFDLRWALAF